MAEFEVPEEEREFKGAPDDRKGMLEFRQAGLPRTPAPSQRRRLLLCRRLLLRPCLPPLAARPPKAFKLSWLAWLA